MNAYELAQYLEIAFYEDEDIEKAATMLRQQEDRITMLEKETNALRKQLISACNELMEIKR